MSTFDVGFGTVGQTLGYDARGLANVSTLAQPQQRPRTLSSALESLRFLEGIAQDLRVRTGKLRSVMCGPEPQQGGQAEARPPSAAIDALVEKTEDVNRLLQIVADNLMHIEQVIG